MSSPCSASPSTAATESSCQIETWGHTAGVVVAHLTVGRQVEVHGRLAQRDWTDKATGQKRTWNYVIADTVGFLDRKPVDDDDHSPIEHLAGVEPARH